MTLNPKQRVFVAAYIGEAKHNATEAARLAGYKQPHVQGSQLLAKLSVKQAIEEHLSAIERKGIADRQYRVDALAQRHRLLERVIAERAADAWTADVPGGSTGLVVKQLKSVKHIYERDPSDPDREPRQVSVEMWESSIDTGLLREMREHEKQIAQELGEWTEKRELSGPDGGAIPILGIEVPRPAGDA